MAPDILLRKEGEPMRKKTAASLLVSAALLLSAGLLPPAALQLPIRTLRPARQSYQRIRGFLKN